MTTERKRCKGMTVGGKPCRGFALADGYCLAHSPAYRDKCDEARVRGGRNSSKAARLRGLVPPRLIGVYDRLEEALAEVHAGTLPASRATAMAAVAKAMVSVIQSGELEERIRALESKLTTEARHGDY